MTAIAACGGLRLGSRAAEPARPAQASPERVASAAPTIDPVNFYRQLGLIAQGAPLPFVGSVGFLATGRSDSTHAVVALAFATGSLTFRREGELHRADYRVTLTVKQGDAVALQLESTSQPVRVTTIRETERVDESVIFQQLLTLTPGNYTLTVAVRDDGSGKSASTDIAVRVPSLGPGTISSPMPVYEAQPRVSRDAVPMIVASPRAVATSGRDSTIVAYLEAYGDAGESVGIGVQVDNVTVWSESVPLHPAGNGLFTAVARVPVDRIGLGAASLTAWRPGGNDTTRTPIFVGFGDEVAPTTYQDLLSYLRYFGSASRLRDLVAVAPAGRGAAWAAFVRETDPTPSTRENEALLDYLGRLRQAATFQEDATPGWRTDRGMVWLLFGQPDQIIDPFANDASQRGRALVWEYRSLNLSVEFVRAAGVTPWKLTAKSEAEVRAAARRSTGAGNETRY